MQYPRDTLSSFWQHCKNCRNGWSGECNHWARLPRRNGRHHRSTALTLYHPLCNTGDIISGSGLVNGIFRGRCCNEPKSRGSIIYPYTFSCLHRNVRMGRTGFSSGKTMEIIIQQISIDDLFFKGKKRCSYKLNPVALLLIIFNHRTFIIKCKAGHQFWNI